MKWLPGLDKVCNNTHKWFLHFKLLHSHPFLNFLHTFLKSAHTEATWTFEQGYSTICKLINKNILCFSKLLFVDGKTHITQAIYQTKKEKYNCSISTCNGKRKGLNGNMSSVAYLCAWGTEWEHADQVRDSYGKQPVDSQLSKCHDFWCTILQLQYHSYRHPWRDKKKRLRCRFYFIFVLCQATKTRDTVIYREKNPLE